jgi:hypothetical protein
MPIAHTARHLTNSPPVQLATLQTRHQYSSPPYNSPPVQLATLQLATITSRHRYISLPLHLATITSCQPGVVKA